MASRMNITKNIAGNDNAEKNRIACGKASREDTTNMNSGRPRFLKQISDRVSARLRPDDTRDETVVQDCTNEVAEEEMTRIQMKSSDSSATGNAIDDFINAYNSLGTLIDDAEMILEDIGASVPKKLCDLESTKNILGELDSTLNAEREKSWRSRNSSAGSSNYDDGNTHGIVQESAIDDHKALEDAKIIKTKKLFEEDPSEKSVKSVCNYMIIGESTNIKAAIPKADAIGPGGAMSDIKTVKNERVILEDCATVPKKLCRWESTKKLFEEDPSKKSVCNDIISHVSTSIKAAITNADGVAQGGVMSDVKTIKDVKMILEDGVTVPKVEGKPSKISARGHKINRRAAVDITEKRVTNSLQKDTSRSSKFIITLQKRELTKEKSIENGIPKRITKVKSHGVSNVSTVRVEKVISNTKKVVKGTKKKKDGLSKNSRVPFLLGRKKATKQMVIGGVKSLLLRQTDFMIGDVPSNTKNELLQGKTCTKSDQSPHIEKSKTIEGRQTCSILMDDRKSDNFVESNESVTYKSKDSHSDGNTEDKTKSTEETEKTEVWDIGLVVLDSEDAWDHYCCPCTNPVSSSHASDDVSSAEDLCDDGESSASSFLSGHGRNGAHREETDEAIAEESRRWSLFSIGSMIREEIGLLF